MKKLPTKQIYLLVIIIVGIIALSIYSTYAIFTFEGATSNIVSLYTPNSLEISEDMYEYKQVTIPKNSYITTDVDIYNSFDYDLCFSIWYKVVDEANLDREAVKLYILNDTLSSGVINSVTSLRTNLLIVNDNDLDVRINIGISSSKNEESCSLNISKDKQLINYKINNYQELSEYIIDNSDKSVIQEENYLVYKENIDRIVLDTDKVYVSDKYLYQEEVFTLDQYKEIDVKDIINYQSSDMLSYYTCIDNTECRFLYKINEITKETVKDEFSNDDIDIYSITNYDILVGYLEGESGIKKVDDNYLYYGDNPNNFVYYNCINELDTNTCELWRILGIYYDKENNEYYTKIIKNNSLGIYQYDEDNNIEFERSTLYNYLTEQYKLNNYKYLKEITFRQNYLEDIRLTFDDINYFDNDIKSYISIMSLDDYLNASVCEGNTFDKYTEECLNNNYLNLNNGSYWTYTREYKEVLEDDELINEDILREITNDKIYTVSSIINTDEINDELNVRPVLFLKDRVLIVDGDGTFEKPFILR